MRIEEPHRRLAGLWGQVDRQHNEIIAAHVVGPRVLDIGCGYGSLVDFLTEQGFDAVGVDNDAPFIETGLKLFPGADLRVGDGESLRFPEGSFDTVIFKDVMHHVYRESEIAQVLREVRHVLKDRGRLIVLDPSPNVVLKLARKLAAHEDPECAWHEAVAALENGGFSVTHISFLESIGLALSGGYVGPVLVPDNAVLHKLVLSANRTISRVLNLLGLGRALLWRYLIVGVKT